MARAVESRFVEAAWDADGKRIWPDPTADLTPASTRRPRLTPAPATVPPATTPVATPAPTTVARNEKSVEDALQILDSLPDNQPSPVTLTDGQSKDTIVAAGGRLTPNRKSKFRKKIREAVVVEIERQPVETPAPAPAPASAPSEEVGIEALKTKLGKKEKLTVSHVGATTANLSGMTDDALRAMDLAEDFIKSVLGYVLENCKEDLGFLDQRFAKEEAIKPEIKRSPMGLLERLQFVTQNQFKRVSYTEAIDILRNSKPNKKKKFKYTVDGWGIDLQSEHERYLVEKHFTSPVIIFDYPAEIKAFYMRMNEDGKTVRAMDVLFPGVGEMVGGSQREERLDRLVERMKSMDVDLKELWWYLDLRRFGTAIHAGFGLGFERLVLYTTGMNNIRDVIPYPRTPLSAEF